MKRSMIAVVAVLVAAMAAGTPAIASPTIDGTLSPGEWGSPWFYDNTETPGYWQSTPIFTGYVTNDTTNLYIALDVQTNETAMTKIPVWLAFKTTAGTYSQFIAPYDVMTIGYATTPYAASNQPLPTGAAFASILGGGHLYYELQVPLSVLGASPGDTLKYLMHVRDFKNNSIPDDPATTTNYHPEAYSWSPYGALQTYGGNLIIPEPATMALVALGGIGMLVSRKRRK
jgi:hypothetical protein